MDLAGGVSDGRVPTFEEKTLLSVCRGGRWNGSDRDARCASRHPFPPDGVHLGIGFRLAYDAE